jgi:hypothetical protein
MTEVSLEETVDNTEKLRRIGLGELYKLAGDDHPNKAEVKAQYGSTPGR